ncbi:purine-binding chemotaxis protein CheW [bacterium]|nr:purine-binding chemotaxis protein CheW [bacterium]
MARKKLQTFSADDAGDKYIPSVKTLKGADITAEKNEDKKKSVNKSIEAISRKDKKPVKKVSKKEEIRKVKPEHETVPDPKPVKSAASQKEGEKNRNINSKVTSAKKTVSQNRDTISKDLNKVKSESLNNSDAVVQLVGFKIGDEEFGIEIQKVREINRTTEITRVPRTPEYVLGVINLRGNVIPVINMRTKFGFNNKNAGKDSRIIVLELKDNVIGILVDSVTEVIRLPSGTVEPPPNLSTNVETAYINGVGKLEDRLLILLDIDKVFTSEQMDKFAEAAA